MNAPDPQPPTGFSVCRMEWWEKGVLLRSGRWVSKAHLASMERMVAVHNEDALRMGLLQRAATATRSG